MVPKKAEPRLYEEIELSEGIAASIEDHELVMKKDNKVIKRKLNPLVGIKIEGNKLFIKTKKTQKKEKKLFGTYKAHIRNMIKGLSEGFRYELRVANVHFPMNVSYDKNSVLFTVKNFLGEKKDRIIKSLPEVEVKVDKDVIELTSYDIEKAGQVATNLEKGTRVRNKDRRIYQDGIFIVQKPGRSYM